MAIEKVREYLKQFGADGRIRELAESCATVELAAQALHCEPRRIAKTLSFHLDDRVILISGQWSVVGGRWSVVGGRWSVVGGRWSVVGGQWLVVSG